MLEWIPSYIVFSYNWWSWTKHPPCCMGLEDIKQLEESLQHRRSPLVSYQSLLCNCGLYRSKVSPPCFLRLTLFLEFWCNTRHRYFAWGWTYTWPHLSTVDRYTTRNTDNRNKEYSERIYIPMENGIMINRQYLRSAFSPNADIWQLYS